MQLKQNFFKKSVLTTALLLEITTQAHGAIIAVNNDDCTLAQAIESANTDAATGGCVAGNGDDTINLPSNSVIALTTALPPIINDVTINANNATITRDASVQTQFSLIQLGSADYIANLPVLELNDVTLSGGDRAGNYGGAISTLNASLYLNDSTVSNNYGGAITLTSNNTSVINNSIISNNQSSPFGLASYYGGAVSVNSGELTINSSTIADNQSNSGLGGGGIYVSNYAGAVTLNVINSTISGNSTVFDGAGIFHYDFQGLSNSAINITSSTIVNNQANDNGGGIHNELADFVVRQSIISGNTATNSGSEINSLGGTFTLNDYNLIGLNNDDGSSGITLGATDIVPSTNNLNEIIITTLSDNGGNTPTHNLLPGSPALDAISGSCALSVDQIGNNRPNDGDDDMIAACDIGAVEYTVIEDLIFVDGFDFDTN